MEIKGKIIKLLEKQSGVSEKTGKSWAKQSFVFETLENYPKTIAFVAFGESRLQEIADNVGKEMTVHFEINAREYNGRWYNDIVAYKFDVVAASPFEAPSKPVEQPKPEQSNLPFL